MRHTIMRPAIKSHINIDNIQVDAKDFRRQWRYKRPLLFACLLAPGLLALSGCGQPFWLPPAHKIEVQQGNLISVDQKDALTAGLTRDEVSAITGHPIVGNTFHADRWDFIYTRGPAGSSIKARRLTIQFANGVVSSIDDNYAEETGDVPRRQSWWSKLF